MLREPFVDERVIGCQQIDDAPVLANDGVEHQLHLPAHGLAERVVEVRIDQRQRPSTLHPPQVEPLAGEVHGQRLGARILEHPQDLALEHRRILQPALRGERDESVVGRRAPEEERQPRREVEIADAVQLPVLDVRRLGLDPVDETRIGEHAREHHFHAVLEVAVLATRVVERHQRLGFRSGDRTPERPACHGRHDLPRARQFLRGSRWMAGEDPLAARRLLRRRCVERSFDSDRAHVREEREAGRRTGLDRVAHEVLVEIEQRRVVRGQEGRAKHVRTRGRREAHPHGRAAAATEEGFRPLLTTAGWSHPTPASAWWRGATAASRGLSGGAAAIGFRRAEPPAPLPIHQLEPFAVEQNLELLARHRPESGRRHVVAENRRHGHCVLAVGGEDMLDDHAAASTEGKSFDVIVLRGVLGCAIDDQSRLRRLADCEPADFAGRRHVCLDERR